MRMEIDHQSLNVPFLFSNDGTHSGYNGSFILFHPDESRTSPAVPHTKRGLWIRYLQKVVQLDIPMNLIKDNDVYNSMVPILLFFFSDFDEMARNF